MATDAEIQIVIADLSEREAEALAQFCKRITYEAIKAVSASEPERELMDRALMRLERGLKEAGFWPR